MGLPSKMKEKGDLLMVSTIFETITNAITEFAQALGAAVGGIVDLFYTTTESGGQLTFLGTLMLILAGIGIVYGIFRLIRALLYRL